MLLVWLQLSSLLLSTRRRRAEQAAAPRWPETARPRGTGLLHPCTAAHPRLLGLATRNLREGGASWKCLRPMAAHRVSTPGWVQINSSQTLPPTCGAFGDLFLETMIQFTEDNPQTLWWTVSVNVALWSSWSSHSLQTVGEVGLEECLFPSCRL